MTGFKMTKAASIVWCIIFAGLLWTSQLSICVVSICVCVTIALFLYGSKGQDKLAWNRVPYSTKNIELKVESNGFIKWFHEEIPASIVGGKGANLASCAKAGWWVGLCLQIV
jgi:hypothetical protein